MPGQHYVPETEVMEDLLTEWLEENPECPEGCANDCIRCKTERYLSGEDI